MKNIFKSNRTSKSSKEYYDAQIVYENNLVKNLWTTGSVPYQNVYTTDGSDGYEGTKYLDKTEYDKTFKEHFENGNELNKNILDLAVQRYKLNRAKDPDRDVDNQELVYGVIADIPLIEESEGVQDPNAFKIGVFLFDAQQSKLYPPMGKSKREMIGKRIRKIALRKAGLGYDNATYLKPKTPISATADLLHTHSFGDYLDDHSLYKLKG